MNEIVVLQKKELILQVVKNREQIIVYKLPWQFSVMKGFSIFIHKFTFKYQF